MNGNDGKCYIYVIKIRIVTYEDVGGFIMRMERIVIQLPMPLKQQLDGLRSQGYTTSGYIRALLERELNQSHTKKGV